MTLRQVKQRYSYSLILLKRLVIVDFKLRYQGSVLGYLWSLLRPMLIFLILYFVFTVFLPVGKGVPYYPVYLLLGIVLWNFFGEITSGSVGAIVDRGDIMRKLNFPKYNIIVAKGFAAIINLFFNAIVIGVFMYFEHVHLTWQALIILPLLLELFVIALAFAFLLSALFVKFRDVTYIWEVFMQGGIYATPVIYPLSRIHYHKVREIMLLNPIAQVIQDSRYVLVTHSSDIINTEFGGDKWIWAIPIGLTVALFVWGGWYFRSHSKYFAEEV